MSEVNPDIWEHGLAVEGMPAELPYNLVLAGGLANRVEAVRADLQTELDRPPIAEELLPELGELSGSQSRMIQEYGIRIPWDEAVMMTRDAITADDPTFDAVNSRRLSEATQRTIKNNLSDREASILRRRMEGATLQMVATEDGVKRERIRVIEARAMAKMRLSQLASPLGDMLRVTEPPHKKLPERLRHVTPFVTPQTIEESYHNYAIASEDRLARHVAANGIAALRTIVEQGDTNAATALLAVQEQVDLSEHFSHYPYVNLVSAVKPHLLRRYDLSEVYGVSRPPNIGEPRPESQVWRAGLALLDLLENRRRWTSNVVRVKTEAY